MYEIDTDRRYVTLGVCVICKPEQQARFSNTRVPDEEEFEKIVVSGKPAVLALQNRILIQPR